MKKSLLFAAVLSLALTASAQVARNAGTAKQTKAVATQQLKDVKVDHQMAERYTGQNQLAQRPKKAVPANSAYYLRPKGTMYCNWDKTGSGFIMPFVYTKPYDEVTWRNMSTAQGRPSWGYWLWGYNETAQDWQRDSLVTDEYDLTVRYQAEYEDAPYLTMGGGPAYTLSGYRVNRTTGAIENEANSGVASVVNSREIYSELETNMLSSAHYFGSSNRFGTEAYGWIYYSGAPGPDYDPEAQDPDRSGYWFGKNYGDWNVFGCGFEKPISPYVLNNIYFRVTALEVKADVDLEARVYRLSDLPAYNDTAAAQIDPAMLTEENLIATGRTTITTDMNEEGSAILEFTLYETDPVVGIEYETTPQIDDAIVILILGMDQEDIVSISGLVTTDDEDEGVGEVTFMGYQQDGEIIRCVGINNFFTDGALKVGSSIVIDVTRPYMVFNYSFEEGKYTFPNEGGELGYIVGGETFTGIEFYCVSPKADWTMTTDKGAEVPDWLTIELNDVLEDGEFTGLVDANVVAAALPDGMQGREATVRFAINGAYIDYHFIQGTPPEFLPGDANGDGRIDIDDVNIIINIMLAKATLEEYPGADATGDGRVDVDDLNYDINVMLGKVPTAE